MQSNKDFSIFIRYLKGKTTIISIYVKDFLLASNTIIIFKVLNKFFFKEYNRKNLGKVKPIIG